ncbi:ADP-ribosylation factor-like protein 2-binding protein isoform X2 [Anabrus simplex]
MPANDEDRLFDLVIGHIEDVLMEDRFQQLQKCFLEKYWQEFEDGDENKLCYSEIFKEYIEVVEKHIESQLASKIPEFSMETFVKQLEQRREDLDGEVFEMLYTFSDFLAFKEMFLDYKAIKEGTVQDLSDLCSVTNYYEQNGM